MSTAEASNNGAEAVTSTADAGSWQSPVIPLDIPRGFATILCLPSLSFARLRCNPKSRQLKATKMEMKEAGRRLLHAASVRDVVAIRVVLFRNSLCFFRADFGAVSAVASLYKTLFF